MVHKQTARTFTRTLWFWMALVLSSLLVSTLAAQDGDPRTSGGLGTVQEERGGFTLTFTSRDPNLLAQTANNLIETFFHAIQAESAYFNPSCPHRVTLLITPQSSCGVACAGGTDIEVSAQHMAAYPADYDLITHEAMHIVQAYPGLSCGHWVEGEADMARAQWGRNNAAAGWSLPQPNPQSRYTDSYGTTGAFLNWIFMRYGDGPILALDRSLRAGRCPDSAFWRDNTGYESVDALWNVYVTGAEPN